MSFSSDEVNYLVYRYLLESGNSVLILLSDVLSLKRASAAATRSLQKKHSAYTPLFFVMIELLQLMRILMINHLIHH